MYLFLYEIPPFLKSMFRSYWRQRPNRRFLRKAPSKSKLQLEGI
jgi:hypothetical protein